jgi:hypothetical protein
MSRKLILKNVRFSYVRVFEAEQFNGVGESNYSVTLLIPKSDTALIKQINDAVKAEAQAYFGSDPKFKGRVPENYKSPLKDGDAPEKEEQAEYEGCYYITAKRKEKLGRPIVIDKGKRPITVKEDMYSGSWGVASISLYGYNMSSDIRGITAGLNGIQKVTDDDRLDGGSSVNDFEDLSNENDDPFGMNDDLRF